MRILAIIPARGGSKSIYRKNIINIGGIPLIAWTIKAALKSRYITKTIVSSEDTEILKISSKYGAETLVRPRKYAQDDTAMTSVVTHALNHFKRNDEEFDILVLLQATSPLRDTNDIDTAIQLYIQKKATAIISGYKPEKSPYKSFRVTSGGLLRGLVNDKSPFMNRQQLPETFYPNGAIHLIKITEFLRLKSFLTSKTLPYIMSSKKSMDIDTSKDIKLLSRALLKGSISK